MWMSSVKSHMDRLDNVVRSVEKLFEGEFYCLGAQKEDQFLVFSL